MRRIRLGFIVAIALACLIGPGCRLQEEERAPQSRQKGATLIGRVLSPDGKPVKNVEIGSPDTRRHVKTDGHGAFRMENLQPHVIDESGATPQQWSASFYARHPDFVPVWFGPVTLRTGTATRRIEVKLIAGGRIGGTVTTEDGTPVPNGRVTVRRRTPLRILDNQALRTEKVQVQPWQSEEMSCSTDGSGVFCSEPLLPAEYRVWADAPSLVESDVQTVKVIEKETAQLSLVLPKGVSIAGKVVDSDGKPVSAAEVMTRGREDSVWTDDDGRFSIRGLKPGRCEIRVAATGYRHNFLPFHRTCTAPDDDIVIKLRTGGRIVGQVVDKVTRNPIHAFFISLTPQRWAPRLGPCVSLTEVSSIRTDPEGRFEEKGISAGTYTLRIRHKNYAPAVVRNISVREGAEPQEVLVELTKGTKLTFLVTSADDDSPVPRATISSSETAALGSSEEPSVTDAEGRLSFEHFGPGQHVFKVFGYKFATKTFTVSIAPGEEHRVVKVALEKEPAAKEPASWPEQYGWISGRVTTTGGRPAPGLALRRLCWSYRPEYETQTDGKGEYKLPVLDNAMYRVALYRHVGDRSLSLIVKRAPAREGVRTQLDFVIGVGAAIYGSVMRGGHPLAGVEILASPARVATDAWCGTGGLALTDDRGEYRIEGLDPGSYALSFDLRTVGGEGLTRREFRISKEDLELNVELSTGDVSGTVVGPHLEPLPGAAVCLVPAFDRTDPTIVEAAMHDLLASIAETDENGAFVLTDVAAGRYHIYAQKVGFAPCRLTLEKGPKADIKGLKASLAEEVVLVAQIKTENGDIPESLLIAVSDESGALLTVYVFSVDTVNGQCRIDGVPPGTVTITAQAKGYSPVRKRMSLAPGTVANVEFLLSRGHDLAVTVVDDEGDPVLGAECVLEAGIDPLLEALLAHTLAWEFEDISQEDQNWLDGTHLLPHLNDGDYTVRVLADGYEPAAAPVRLTPAQPDAQ